MIKDGMTIYKILRDVSKSGITRRISFFIIKDNEPLLIDYEITQILKDYKIHKEGGVIVKGCGMDMGFHVVNSLEIALGIKLKDYWM